MKIISITILLLLVGCDETYVFEPTLPIPYHVNNEYSSNYTCDYTLTLDSYLYMDVNGYYHMEFLNEYNQTFTTLTAYTNSTDAYQNVGWLSGQEININGYWVNLVNQNSYTDENGEAHTVLSVWETFIGDTITVYSGYTDQCNIQYIDSLKFIIK